MPDFYLKLGRLSSPLQGIKVKNNCPTRAMQPIATLRLIFSLGTGKPYNGKDDL